tara:strand:- start:817 stop:2055 length:1239 start_codon:yes stop_codon:yes gene_type:complete
VNIDNTYDPTNISKNYLSGQEFTNQVSIEQGFNVELFEVSDKLAFIKNFGNVAVFKDGSKGLLIDTGMGVSSYQVINKLKEWGIDEIEYIIYTHGHVDHVGGTDLIAKAFKNDFLKVVSHEKVVERFDRYKKTIGYNGIINQRQFGLPAPVFPNEFRYPDITYKENYEINFNDSVINLIHGKGETDDATYLYSEKEDSIFAGDFFIWSLPNAGNPSKAQRYVGSWGEVLKDMSKYNAEFLFPGHGPLIQGKDTIKEILLNTSNCLLWIEENVLKLMNQGSTLRNIQDKITLPDEFNQPYLVSSYDDFSFLINSVWRQYGGWYSGIPSELKPPSLFDMGSAYIDMAGGKENLLMFLQSLLAENKYKEASVLIDSISAVEPVFYRDIKNEIYSFLADHEPSLMAKGIYNFNLDT